MYNIEKKYLNTAVTTREMFLSFLLSKSSEDKCHELHLQKAIYFRVYIRRGGGWQMHGHMSGTLTVKGKPKNDSLIAQGQERV